MIQNSKKTIKGDLAMRHVKHLTVTKAVVKEDDSFAETIFFQFFFTIASIMIAAATGNK